MAVLLALLPAELLSHICEFVDPGDFVNFSLLNRRLSRIAEPFRARHYEQWSSYGVVQDRTNTGYWFWHNILRSVLEGWNGAKYVRVIKVNFAKDTPDWDVTNSSLEELPRFIHDWDYEECREVLRPNPETPQQALQRFLRRSDVRHVPREHRQVLVETLKRAPWVADTDLSQALSELHKVSLVLALLVSHLPNLETLNIARYSSSSLYHLRNAVSHAALSLSVSEVRYGPLSHLKEVVLMVEDKEDEQLTTDSDNGFSGDIEPSFLLPFLSLPSIQSLKASHVIGQMSNQRTKLPPSQLAHLSLRSLDIAPMALSSILESSTNLRSCELTTNATSCRFRVASAVDALLENARNTLERLTLHADLVHSTAGQSVSFAGLIRLISLDITYDCLCLSSVDAARVITLSDVLPVSLKTLKIRTHQYRESLIPSVLTLLVNSSPKQAELECLSLKSWIEEQDRKSIQHACQMRNIRCEGDLGFQAVGRKSRVISVNSAIGPVGLTGAGNPTVRPGLSLHILTGPSSSAG